MIKIIKAAFKNVAVNITSDETYVNFSRKTDGVHCEFNLSGVFLSGTYEVSGKQTDINLDLTDEVDMELLVHYVRVILELGTPKVKKHRKGKYPPLTLIKGGRAA